MDEVVRAAVAAVGVSNARVLNDGGQKSVVEGELNGERVALKVIDLSRGSESPEVTLVRAQREFEALDGERSDNLVGVRSALVILNNDEGAPLAVAWAEEYVDGTDLRGCLGTPWSWDATRELIHDVAKGLGTLHERGIVHRDLTPANVMRRAAGGYVVLDPGYARFVDYTTITRLGQPGTPGYLSPEHLDAIEGPESRSDIFQLGILAFTALTGRLPYPANDPAPLLAGDAASLAAACPDLTDAQVTVVTRCIERRPARRYRTVADLLHAIETIE